MDYTGQSLDRGEDGLPKLPEQPLDTEFEKKFPPDPTLGDEIGEAARVWKVYRAEAEAHDNTMLDGWNKTLDVLLIFAGLFSAVATAFLIDSYKLLQPDNSAAYISTALYLLVLRDTVSSSIPLPLPPPLATSATTIARAVNWLWFTSLLLSLSVALLGILVKQWIVEYNARNAVSAESPINWAIRRQMYFNGIIAWPVANLVSVLPVMLHASLFLFLAGVALFVWNLDLAIGAWIAVLGVLLGGFYMACSLLPIWVPECPTSTPLIHLLRRYFFALQIIALQLCVYLYTRTSQLHASARRVMSLFHPGLAYDTEASSNTSRDGSIDDGHSGAAQTSHRETTSSSPIDRSRDLGHSHAIQQLTAAVSQLRARQRRSMVAGVLQERVDTLTADGLLWLMFSVADSDARAVGMQALGAVPSYGAVAEHLRSDTRLTRMDRRNLRTPSAGGRSPVESTRIVRSMLWFGDCSSAPDKALDVELYIALLRLPGNYPDLLFLRTFGRTLWPFIPEIVENPPPPKTTSLSSTVLLFLRARHLDFTDLITALLWCDFALFLDEDWTFVLERIVSEGSRGTSFLLLPITAPILCIVDVLAQRIMQSPGSSNNMAVHRLLISLLERIRDPNRYDNNALIVSSSFVSKYLVSEFFAEQQIQSDVLRSVTSTVLRHASLLVQAYPPAMETYFILLSSFLPLLLREQAEVPDGICLECSDVLAASNAPEGVQDGQILSLTLRRILTPTKRQPFLSVWDMLRRTEDSPQLANTLAQTLCLAERAGEDVSALVDIFLSHLSLKDLFEMYKTQIDQYRRYGFAFTIAFVPWVTPSIQKCVDLRSTWWFDSLTAIREDECADPELKEHLDALETVPLFRGPCDSCHRLPRGWEEDGDAPASCGFNPAAPYLSNPPDRLSTPDARTPWHCPFCEEDPLAS